MNKNENRTTIVNINETKIVPFQRSLKFIDI